MCCKYESKMPKNCDILNFNFHVACQTNFFLKHNCMLQFLDVHGTIESLYNQKYDYCTPKNICFLFSCCMSKNFYFQCKHIHDYNDLIFYIFADRFMPEARGAMPEHNMPEYLVLFIKTNKEEVNKIARSF